MSFLPLVKPDHTLPLEVDRLCPTCQTRSVYINFSGPFYMRCLNRYCPERHHAEYIQCLLRHRDHALVDMAFKVDGVLALDDLEDPANFPEQKDGPYRQCDGVLAWDSTQPATRNTWVECTKCNAVHRVWIFACYGLAGPNLYHNDFRVRLAKSNNGDSTGEVVSSWDSTARNIAKISPQVALIIDKILWNGHEIREVQSIKI